MVTRILLCISLFFTGQVFASPDIQHWQTSNGARVYFVPAPSIPMVDIRVVFDAGSARDGDTPGLALLTNSMLDEGAGSWSADDIAERLDSVGAKLSLSSLRDMGSVSLRSITQPQAFDKAVEVFATVLAQPTFPEKNFGRLKTAILTALKKEQESPGDIAERQFYASMYNGHEYASPPKGTAASVKSLTSDQARAFHAQYYVAKNAVVAIVGDLDRAAAEALAERVTRKMAVGEAAAPIAEVAPLQEAVAPEISFPSTQTHIVIGQPGVKRGDPDWYALYVGNYVLGGSGLVSRLADEIREKRGLTYSVYSYFSPMRQAGPFKMSAKTRNDQAELTRGLMESILNDFVEQGPTDKELQAAIRGITGGFALRLDSNSKLVEYLAAIGFYNMPLDYLDKFSDNIRAVSGDDVRRAFKRHLDPSRLVTVIIGGEK